MWSKTKQILESRLPKNLKTRVKYNYDVYRNGNSEIQSLSIIVDKKPWFITNPKMFNVQHPTSWGGLDSITTEEAIMKSGYVDNSYGEVMKYIHQFLNDLPIDKALSHKNYFIRLLAILEILGLECDA